MKNKKVIYPKNKGEFIFADNGLTYYNIGSADETKEEVEQKNKEYYDLENSFIPQIIQDGFIEFPILFETFGEEIWSSFYLPPNFLPSNTIGFREKFGMDYNIYIPSYKRAKTSFTFKTLKKLGVHNCYMVIDACQYNDYKEEHGIEHLIIRDSSFRSESKMDSISSVVCSDLYRGAASIFNPLLYLSKNLGEKTYFTMDDDFPSFGIRVRKEPLKEGEDPSYDKDKWLRASSLGPEDIDFKEFLGDLGDLFLKIRNRGMMGLEKYGLAFARAFGDLSKTRNYSCYLSSNDRQIDHYSRQNDDIITSLGMLKAGYVNIVYHGISYASIDTQSDKGGTGGMTEVYKRFGTLDKGYCLVRAHPQWTKIANVYNRIHHSADYSGYTKRRLLGEIKK